MLQLLLQGSTENADMHSTTPIYITLIIYLISMVVVTIIANRQNAAEEERNGEDGAVSTHFLGGKDMGMFVLTMTSFASIFSGYTVVGVPNSAAKNAFNEFRWMGAILCIAIGSTLTNARVRRLSVVRNYLSPGDFFMDRYNSVAIKFIASLSMCIPQLLYLAVQFHSLAAMLNQLSYKQLDFYWMVFLSMILILVFEALGGMRSVAYTDTVQACVMVAVFILVPIVISFKYGGFGGQVANGNEVCDAAEFINATLGLQPGMGCLNVGDGTMNGGKVLAPNFWLRTPSTISNVNVLLFYVSFLSFGLNPHILQRVLSAKSDKALKFVTTLTWGMGFLAMYTGILIGTTMLSRKELLSPEQQKQNGFYALLNVWREDESLFLNFLVYVLIMAATAGIMSTADSALIGVSNTISVDLYKNWWNPEASGKATIYFGKAVSLITALASGLIACIMEGGRQPGMPVSYGTLASLQGGILWQVFPAFLFGLFTNITTRSVLRGMIVGLIFTSVLIVVEEFSKTKGDDHESVWAMMHDDGVKLTAGANGILGALVNIVTCLIGWCVDPKKDEAAPKLDYDGIQRIMEGIVEPITFKNGLFVFAALACLFFSFFGRIDSIDPALAGIEGITRYMFNGHVNHVIFGVPAYTFIEIVFMVACALCGIFAVRQWTVDGEGEEGNSGEREGHDMGYVAMENESLNPAHGLRLTQVTAENGNLK
jgi:SSS family solute:Na+ symporter/sodium/pantothenate symporter